MIKDMVRNMARNCANSMNGGLSTRWAYRFDGVDDYGVLANRAINPDGDNNFVFWSPDESASSTTIISQNVSGVISSREFQLYISSSGTLEIIFGGQVTQLCTRLEGYKPNKKYYLDLKGNTFTLAEGARTNIVRTSSFVKGSAREPNAVTVIGARTNGSVGAYSVFSKGLQYDLEINGTLWPIADRNQTIQPSIPAGNPLTLVNTTSAGWEEISV